MTKPFMKRWQATGIVAAALVAILTLLSGVWGILKVARGSFLADVRTEIKSASDKDDRHYRELTENDSLIGVQMSLLAAAMREGRDSRRERLLGKAEGIGIMVGKGKR